MKEFIRITGILLIVIASSCNKDKAAIKDIDGRWYEYESSIVVKDSVIESIDRLYYSGAFYFYRCNPKKEDFCDLLIQYIPSDTVHIDFLYGFSIKDKGDSLLIREGKKETDFVNRFKLISLENDQFILGKSSHKDTLERRTFIRVK